MVHVSVTVDDGHLGRIGTVADALRANGMDVEQVLDALGMITGSVSEESRAALSDVAGVVSVSAELGIQLPPPDSPIQ